MASVFFVLLLASPSHGGRRAKPRPEPSPAVEHVPEPLPVLDRLWGDGLPAAAGRIPVGLANLSAQGCRACHEGQHEGWSTGHGSSARSSPWRGAAEAAGDPTCAACHQPLEEQHPGESFDAGLSLEGVTCASCHVRDGFVLTARAADAPASPHPLAHSPALADDTVCAACHQLTWSGADRPLYDTGSTWQTSAYAEAGVSCTACHGSHGPPLDPAQAVSVLLDVERLEVRRGGPPLRAKITLQNTGSGHAFPAGSPFRAVQVRLALDHEDGVTSASESLTLLGRELATEAPWLTQTDSRLGIGETRVLDWEGALPLDSPTGNWVFHVTLSEVVSGSADAAPFVDQRLPLRVD